MGKRVFWGIILGILLLGLVTRFAVPYYLLLSDPAHNENSSKKLAEISEGLGEALIIAVILAGVVDPYIKFKLSNEIGREIAKETLGEHLPVQLRQALEAIHRIDLYLYEMLIDIKIDAVESRPSLMLWNSRISFFLRNASWAPIEYTHRVWINDERDGRIVEVAHYIDNKPKYKIYESDPELKQLCETKGQDTVFTYTPASNIPSDRKAPVSTFKYFQNTQTVLAPSEVEAIQVIRPTVGISLTVRHPRGMKIRTSLEELDGITPDCPDGEDPNEVSRWRSEKAYLPHEHIWIVYEHATPALFSSAAGQL
jgi:hypothetical protein